MTWREATSDPGEYIRRMDKMDWAIVVLVTIIIITVIVSVVTR